MTHVKPTLPQKTCLACLRPFAWRKKWAKTWDEVRYCSKRCRAAKKDRPYWELNAVALGERSQE